MLVERAKDNGRVIVTSDFDLGDILVEDTRNRVRTLPISLA
jgi:hypothetical protein